MSTYGKGSINFEAGKFRVRISDGSGNAVTIGRYDTAEEAERMRDAGLVARAEIGVGVTLRTFGEVWLKQIKDLKSIGGFDRLGRAFSSMLPSPIWRSRV